MSAPGPFDHGLRLPKPGPGLKVLLGLVIAFAIVGAVAPTAMKWVAFAPVDFIEALKHGQIPLVWTLLTSGVASPPDVIHIVFVLAMLYLGTPDVERRWGPQRLLRFAAISFLFGNVLVLLGALLPIAREAFHPPFVMGPVALIVSITVAWSKENWTAQTRFLGLIPMSGRTLFYVALVGSVAAIFSNNFAEGVFAPLGGFLAGFLFAGNPSPVRTAWLKLRLRSLQKQSAGKGVTVSELLGDIEPPRSSRPKRASKGGPSLRILQGGLEDELKNRKPPKDKRYLN